MRSARPQTLQLFYIDGRPDGMLTASVFNWTGRVLMAPRTRLSEAIMRPEARHTGVYILLGVDDDGAPHGYIGEGEDVSSRIRSHETTKDWWTSVVFVSGDENKLNKAHVQYLEARLIEIARSIGKMRLDNGTSPSRPSLSEADEANMEAFLDYLLMVLPALRIDSFLEDRRPAAISTTAQPALPRGIARFEMRNQKHGIKGTARLQNGEFIVESGSIAKFGWRESSNHVYRRLFEELVRAGVLAPHGQAHRIFTADYAFRSPSAAAAVLNGRAANGQEVWRVPGSRTTYRQWEEQQL